MTSTMSSKKAAVAKANPVDLVSEGPLFALSPQCQGNKATVGSKLQNWEDNPFFKQIANDRHDFNVSMGRKYNLDFTNNDCIFDTKGFKSEINSGIRSNIIWEPIKPPNDMVRWNSYETRTLDQKNHNSI